MKTYSFRAELQREEDSRWSAWISALPGCAAWGNTREEALDALRDAAQAYLADMLEAHEDIPAKTPAKSDGPLLTVTV